MPADDVKLYAPYARETFVGPSAAFLAIDLYNLVYRGGLGAPVDLDPQYPNSCGVYAHRAIEPTKRLFAAVRRAGLPVFYSTQDHLPHEAPGRADFRLHRSRQPTPRIWSTTMPGSGGS